MVVEAVGSVGAVEGAGVVGAVWHPSSSKFEGTTDQPFLPFNCDPSAPFLKDW